MLQITCKVCGTPPHYRDWDDEMVCENCLWFINEITSLEQAINKGLDRGLLMVETAGNQ